ncbi:MAG TPA: hypothetical protein VGQ83_19075 [Polyangia bacterium]|jgi:hypothetical protein
MTTLAVTFYWRQAGRVALDARGGLVFPSLPAVPGLYRFWIESDPRPGVYIGEASDLRRRMQHYRTPGPSQTTNVRLNMLLKDAIGGGSVVSVWILTEAEMRLDAEEPQPLDLNRRNGRLIAEQAAITATAIEDVSDLDGPPVYPRLLDRPGVGEDEYA